MSRASRESVAYQLELMEEQAIQSPAWESNAVPQPEIPERTRETGQRSKPGLRVLPTPKKHALTNPRLLLLLTVVIAVGMLMIHSQMQLTQMTKEIASLTAKLDEAEALSVSLQTRQNKIFSTDVVDDYAVNELGMVRLETSQYEYVEMSNPDRIEVAGVTEDESTLLERIQQFFVSLGERMQ